MTLDEILARAIPIEPGECRIKRAKKEAMRLQAKKSILLLIAQNFTPKEKPSVKTPGEIR